MPALRSTLRLLPPLTFLAILLALHARPARADLDVVFVIDTTGSMGGELAEAQQRLRDLAGALARSRGGERLRFGVVAFRDRGDDYVTLASALTAEIGTTEAFLAKLEAGGGGDEPEAVMTGVTTALREMDWDRAPATERRLVLVGDAPAHLDYSDEPTPEEVIAEARRARIVIDTIGCRSLPAEGVALFRRLAYGTEGSYQHIGRVERPDGELMAALDRVARGGAGGLAAGEDLALSPLGHLEVPSSVLLVRLVSAAAGAPGNDGCALEVLLPPGLALAGAVEAKRLPDRLLVRLPIGEGGGGGERFAVAGCLPITLPVDVELAGSR
jgi:Mg-chelatase subunit ChlD